VEKRTKIARLINCLMRNIRGGKILQVQDRNYCENSSSSSDCFWYEDKKVETAATKTVS